MPFYATATKSITPRKRDAGGVSRFHPYTDLLLCCSMASYASTFCILLTHTYFVSFSSIQNSTMRANSIIFATCLIQMSSALRASIGLLSTAVIVAKATAESPNLRGLDLRNLDDNCGAFNAPCTNGATCVENVCVCDIGYLPDPSIFPIENAGWFSCIGRNECTEAVSPCAENACCVDYDPPARFKCDCIPGKRHLRLFVVLFEGSLLLGAPFRSILCPPENKI